MFSLFIIPAQTIIGNLIVMTVYTIFKFGREMQTYSVAMLVSWAVLTGLWWSIILYLGGYLHGHGQKVFRSWNTYQWASKQDSKLIGKFIKSCRPITVNYGKLSVMIRLSSLYFIKGLSRSSMRIILAL